MTRTLSLRSSKRKPIKSNENEVPEDCKENSPSIFSQNSRKILLASKSAADVVRIMPNKKMFNESSKENEPPRVSRSSPPSNSHTTLETEKVFSPIRKSIRRMKTQNHTKINETQFGRSVLSDRTNSCAITENETEGKKVHFMKTIDNENKITKKLGSTPKITGNKKEENKENHIPVYKTTSPLRPALSSNLAIEEKDAIYEFEVDENEEQAPKKKRKKRAYTRKAKLGPKALTINNIKYSSSESLSSLSGKPAAQKKKTNKKTKTDVKSQSLVTTLNESSCTTSSAYSFMSHPPSLVSCQRQKPKLSIVQESQSEQSPSLALEANEFVEPIVHTSAGPSTLSNTKTACLSDSQSSHFSPNPRCYSSKSGRTPNPYNDQLPTPRQKIVYTSIFQQESPNVTNHSTSFQDFLSSTPCKRSSLVVRDNNVFDDSYDIPLGVRPSTGFIVKNQNSTVSAPVNDKFFGFDGPEELEEPLLSPIKSSIDLEPTRRSVKSIPLNLSDEQDVPSKPSVQEVINMLKATLPKPAVIKEKETTEVYESSSDSSGINSPTHEQEEISAPVFIKPARRSYERPKKVHYDLEPTEESEEENIEEHKEPPKEVKKCYKKTSNTSKTSKSVKAKPSKAKQRIAKEEEELERLAAQMNAQFQQIEKVHLVVE